MVGLMEIYFRDLGDVWWDIDRDGYIYLKNQEPVLMQLNFTPDQLSNWANFTMDYPTVISFKEQLLILGYDVRAE
jgi:hypothetical protein